MIIHQRYLAEPTSTLTFSIKERAVTQETFKEHPLLTVRVSLSDQAVLPQRAREDDVGYDLTATSVEVAARAHPESYTYLVDFGICLEPPPGYYFELIPRSSIAWTGFILANSIGVIDPDYRGTLKMPLIYIGRDIVDRAVIDQLAQSLIGKRLAQLVLRQKLSCHFEQVERGSLTDTPRGGQGFGSSGE